MPSLQWYVRDCSHHPSHVSFPRDSHRVASGDRESRGGGVRVGACDSGGGPHWPATPGDSWRVSRKGRSVYPHARGLLRRRLQRHPRNDVIGG